MTGGGAPPPYTVVSVRRGGKGPPDVFDVAIAGARRGTAHRRQGRRSIRNTIHLTSTWGRWGNRGQVMAAGARRSSGVHQPLDEC